MEIILASNNQHKKTELQQLLPLVKLLSPADFGVEFHCDETGASYQENAQLKAWQLFHQLHHPVLADDSGLEVAALNCRPGIHSARYASSSTELADSQQQISLLLEELEGCAARQAFFICGLALILDHRHFYYVQCSLAGSIANEVSGSQGFGYDPIFYLEDLQLTLAEIELVQKNRISHRGQAAQKIAALIAE